MAALLGADERSYAPGYSLIAAERWGHAAYRKQVVGQPRQDDKLDSFDGSCSVQGTSSFTPPATNSEQSLQVSYDGSGTCTGTLDGRNVSNAPIKMHSTAHSEGSCQQAHTTEPGQGAITFADGTAIRYTFDFTSVLTQVDLTYYGERSGTARGQGSFLTPRTTPDVAAKCAGDGAAEVPLDISLTTDSPLVSARLAPTKSTAPDRSGGPPDPGTGRARSRP
jgi:hypothetical protein